MIRNFLIYLRKQYAHNKRKFLSLMGIISVISTIMGLLLDNLTPFSGAWMVARSVLCIPLMFSLYSLFYYVSLVLHKQRVRENREWIPYRLRYSPKWRRRMIAIWGAFLVVFIYSVGYGPTYTLSSSLCLVSIIACLAFIRPTKQEALREELNLPDMRDLLAKQHLDEKQEDSE